MDAGVDAGDITVAAAAAAAADVNVMHHGGTDGKIGGLSYGCQFCGFLAQLG